MKNLRKYFNRDIICCSEERLKELVRLHIDVDIIWHINSFIYVNCGRVVVNSCLPVIDLIKNKL